MQATALRRDAAGDTDTSQREEFVRSYDFSRYIPPEETDPRFVEEVRRHFLLRARGYRSLAVTSPRIDGVWHTMIYGDTREYARFCDGAFGSFLHHVSARFTHPNAEVRAQRRTRFFAAYREMFGEEAPSEFWSREDDKCVDCCGD